MYSSRFVSRPLQKMLDGKGTMNHTKMEFKTDLNEIHDSLEPV